MRHPLRCRLSVRSNFALRCSQPSLRAPVPAAASSARRVFCHASITWNSGLWLRLRAGLQHLDHLLERQVLVLLRAPARCAFTCCSSSPTLGCSLRSTRSASVLTKKPISASTSPAAVGHRRADHDVLLARQPRQQRRPGGQQRHEQRRAVALAERLQRRVSAASSCEPRCARRHGPAAPAAAGRSASSSSAGAPASCCFQYCSCRCSTSPRSQWRCQARSRRTGSPAAAADRPRPRRKAAYSAPQLARRARPSTSRRRRCGASSPAARARRRRARSSRPRISGPVLRSNGRGGLFAGDAARAPPARAADRLGSSARSRRRAAMTLHRLAVDAARSVVRSASCRATMRSSARCSAAGRAARQAQAARHVVRRAGLRIELVEEPQPLLRERQRQRARLPIGAARSRRARLCAALGRLRASAAQARMRRTACRSGSSTPSAGAAARPAAPPAASGRRARRSCRAGRRARRRSSSCHRSRPASLRSRPAAPRTARAHRRRASGAGSALRSSLPLGVSGRRSSRTNAAGTMYSGSCARQRRAQRVDVESQRLAHDIGHQALVARHVLAREHHRLAHAGHVGQPRLDLAELDAEAADLHLEVVAAEELDVAVGQPAPQVAGLVHPRAGLVRTDRPRSAPRSARAGSGSRAPPGAADVQLARPRPPAPAAAPRSRT